MACDIQTLYTHTCSNANDYRSSPDFITHGHYNVQSDSVTPHSHNLYIHMYLVPYITLFSMNLLQVGMNINKGENIPREGIGTRQFGKMAVFIYLWHTNAKFQ